MTPETILDHTEPPCPACAAPENRGLCHSEYCRRAVLPQITTNGRLRALMAEADDNAIARLQVLVTEHSAETTRREARAAALARQAFGAKRQRVCKPRPAKVA